MWAFHAKLWDWRWLEANIGISALDTLSLGSFTCWWENSAWSNSKITQKKKGAFRGKKQTNTKTGQARNTVSVLGYPTQNIEIIVISYKKMQFLLQVQGHQIQERELSLTPWRNIRHEHMCSVTQPCLTLCNPVDCNPKGSSVHGVFQARILEWVAMPFSKGSSWLRDLTCTSCVSWHADSLLRWHLGSPWI